MLRYAAKCGYQSVRRKEGVSIDLTAVDIERPNAFQYYSDQHLDRTRTFVEKLLDQAGATALQEQIDDGQRAFGDRLRAGGSGAGGGSKPENQQDQ